ncbi:MAG: FAD-binding oxidoreductase, partial [Bradymonadaceae bacterium]
ETASRHGVDVHPQSRGKNFGYGGGHPSTDGAVILDLGRMDEILEFDEKLGYIILEPGVTFRQLHEYLRERDSQFQCPINGAPKDASLIGNRLERGQVGVHWQAQDTLPLADLEVVLANGRRIHTGASTLPEARAASVRPFPPGPDPTELFTQSNLGVVTRATLWLPRANDKPRFVTFNVPDPEAFRHVLPRLRELMFDGLIEPGFQLHNDYRTFAGRREWNYPTDELEGTTPVPESMLEDVPSWSTVIFLRPEDGLAG